MSNCEQHVQAPLTDILYAHHEVIISTLHVHLDHHNPLDVIVVGRKAGSQPGFTGYSPALKASNLTWSKKTLDKFLINPGEMVPGTFMPIEIPDDKTRADVVAYLATLKK